MPPADNTNTPAPAPVPEPPKQGFFAKLFGKKPKTDAVVAPPHESQTPQPNLEDTTVTQDTAAPVTPLTSPDVPTQAPAADASVSPELSPSAPTISPDEESKTIEVPGSVSAQPVETTEGDTVSPTLPTQPEAAGDPQPSTTPEEPKPGAPTNPA